MKIRKAVYFVFLSLFIVGASFSVFKILKKTSEFKEEREKYTEAVLFTHGIMDPMSWLPIGSWEEHVERADVFKARSNRALDEINFYGIALSIGAIVFILFTLFIFLRNQLIWKYLAGTLTIISVVALIVGVSTPMMEMAAFSTDLTDFPIDGSQAKGSIPLIPDMYFDAIDFDIKFDGRMYYFYQSKSILGLIGILFSQGNYPVGIAILLFSLVVPILKLILTFGHMISDKFGKQGFVRFVLNYLGKWSMADVFVVSLFLGYFSFTNMNVGIETQTEALFGLYCFGGYVILSLLATQFMKAATKKSVAEIVDDLT